MSAPAARGSAFATYGPFVRASVGGATFGGVARVQGDTVPLDLRIETASWFGVDRVEVYVSGRLVRVLEPPSGPSAIVDVDERLVLPAPPSDGWVVVVAMGRGGPAEPEVVESPPTLEELVERSRAGQHAASDHLELATLAGVPTIGCRRAGGGLAGAVFVSNVAAGAALAAERRPDVVIFDGSGAAIPPVDVDRPPT